MNPLAKTLFCQGLKELDTREEFEEVRPVFEFQRKRLAEDPERRARALELFPFRRVPAPIKFVILAARDPTQLEALKLLWEEAYSERMEATNGGPHKTWNPQPTETLHKLDLEKMSLIDRLSREVERLATLKQCAAAGRLVATHCEALSRNDPNVGTKVEIEVLELATGLPRELVRLFTRLTAPQKIQGFVNVLPRRDGAIREEMRKDVWASIHPDNFNCQLPGYTGR